MKVIALYNFAAADESEISLKKNDICTMVEDHGDWLRVSNNTGHSGLVPVSYVAGPVEDGSKIVARGKLKAAHIASSDGELTLNKQNQVAILDTQDDYWWFVGYSGKTGYIPKHIIRLLGEKGKKRDEPKNKIVAITPQKVLCCAENTPVLCVFEKELLAEGEYVATFKGENCEKSVDMERLNDYALKTKTPKYFPAEKVKLTVTHTKPGSPLALISQNVSFEFESKLEVVNTILKNEADPVSLLCSSFKVEHGDLQNVDHILAGNLEKKIPEGFEILKSSKTPTHNDAHSVDIPTLLHFAAYYNLKKLAKAILKCPGSTETLAEKNCQGMVPLDVAKMRHHTDLESILQHHEDLESDDHYEEMYEGMEKIYEEYIKMDDVTYVDTMTDERDIYEDMAGQSAPPEPRYVQPREERGKVEIPKEFEETDIKRGRMTEKELQVALLVKRVKERYITHEQALEMAKILRLEPEVATRATTKPASVPRVSAGLMMSELSDKLQTLPRRVSTSSGSSMSSVSSSGSAGSTGGHHTERPAARPLPSLPPAPMRKSRPATSPPTPRKKMPVPPPRHPPRR